MSVVGLPGEAGHETVAGLIVPEYDQGGMSREDVREAVREHVKKISKSLALYKRLKVMHLWDHDRSEEHTSELQSQSNLVCGLLLAKKQRGEDQGRGAY